MFSALLVVTFKQQKQKCLIIVTYRKISSINFTTTWSFFGAETPFKTILGPIHLRWHVLRSCPVMLLESKH